MGERVYSHWLNTVASNPDSIAVSDIGSGQESTFGSIQDAVSRKIKELQRKGNLRNRVVAIQLQNSSDWLAIFLACQAMNAIALPIDPDVPTESVKSIITQLRVSAIWTSNGFELLESGSIRELACLIKLTSGSTGKPRPLFFDDEQMLADGENVTRTMGIQTSDSNLATIPFGHSYGLGNLVMPCIMKGCAIHICTDPFPHTITATVKDCQTTVYPTVPAILKALIRSEVNPSDIETLRLWISAGSLLDAGVASQFEKTFGRRVHNFYGSSETGGIAYDKSGDDTLSGRSVGKPLAGVTVSVSKSNRLLVKSKAVFSRHNPRTSDKQGSFLLPDLAGILTDGLIRLDGRRARIVKLSGKRLSLAEVEKALLNIPGIDACFVDEYRDSNGRTRVGSVIVSSTDHENIQSSLKSTLASWKIPTRWIRLDQLPTNARGKVDRSGMQELIRSGKTNPERP